MEIAAARTCGCTFGSLTLPTVRQYRKVRRAKKAYQVRSFIAAPP